MIVPRCGIHGIDTSPDEHGNRRCVECDRDARRVRLLTAERDLYHRAICSLLAEATNGGRKTLDKADVARRLGQARDEGGALFRRAKADQ